MRYLPNPLFSLEITVKLDKFEELNRSLQRVSDTTGNLLGKTFHYAALFAIGGTIVWSAVFAFVEMIFNGRASIDDILLLFIYLELGAMVGIYFKTYHMPVRFLLYVGVTGLTRMLVGDIQNHDSNTGIIYITGAILLLSVATLIFRFASNKYPSFGSTDDAST
jgi:phosphate starvation-inducible membrane PsiE